MLSLLVVAICEAGNRRIERGERCSFGEELHLPAIAEAITDDFKCVVMSCCGRMMVWKGGNMVVGVGLSCQVASHLVYSAHLTSCDLPLLLQLLLLFSLNLLCLSFIYFQDLLTRWTPVQYIRFDDRDCGPDIAKIPQFKSTICLQIKHQFWLHAFYITNCVAFRCISTSSHTISTPHFP